MSASWCASHSIFCFGAPLLSDVLLNVDPSAVGQRLIGDEERAARAQMLDLGERAALGELGDMLVQPLGELFLLDRALAAGFLTQW